MTEYLPFAGTNSIQEAVLGLHFAQRLEPASIEAMYNYAQAELANDFPKGNIIHLMQMNLAVSAAMPVAHPAAPQAGGFELSRLRADGRPQRLLRLVNDILTVNYLVYDSWKGFAPPAIQWLQTALSRANLAASPITAFSLRYIDRFTFNGPPAKASAHSLFQPDSPHLTKQCFDSGALWHCYSGWFDKAQEEGARILNQLNIQSAEIDEAPSVIIDHNAVCQLGHPRHSLDALIDPTAPGRLKLVQALDEMHARNEIIVKSLLLPEMVKKIGL